ncbi:MAG: NusA N-terminal domain-containing protein, partial [Candidatus Thermochlorobacter sp.]
MPKRKQEPTVEDRKTQIKSAFNAIEESDKLRDRKAAEVSSMKMDIADLLKEVIQKQLRKDYDPEVNARVIVNPERGDFEVYIMREVVEEVDLPTIQISYEEARQIDDSLELGDFYEEGPIDLKKYLTRKSIQIIKQAVQKKVRDAERDAIFEECREKVGKIVSAEVYQIRPKEIIFTYNTSKNQKVDLILPMSEKMPKDNPRKTPRMKLYVKKVER